MNTSMRPATASDAQNREIKEYRNAIRRQPRNARAHALLGLALQECGLLEEAVASQQRALQLDPGLSALNETIAAALHALGKHTAAAASYRRALAAQGANPVLHTGLSEVLLALGQPEEALASATRAVELRPGDPACLFGLARAQQALNEGQHCIDAFHHVLDRDPGHVEARYQLGRVLHMQKQQREAAAQFRLVLDLQPDNVEAMHALGTCLVDLREFKAAQTVLERALQLAPAHRQAPVALAYACFELGDGEAAIRHARRAVELNPDMPSLHSMLLFILSHCCSDAAELTRAHHGFGQRWDAPEWRPHLNDKNPERVIKVGIVSADLYNHAISTFIEPIIVSLRHSHRISLHVYHNSAHEDAVSERLRAQVSRWQRINGLDDDAAEQLIRADGIDVLVDLSGHSLHNRLPLFARKPAPVQASYLGYAGTTGLRAMDYYIGDQFFLPEGRYDEQFSEQIVRIPLGAAFIPDPHAPPVAPLPALRNGHLTFGSFHRANKISREVVAQWSALLRALPDARMLLGGQKDGGTDVLLGWFAEEGIEAGRLTVRPRASMGEYLAQHHEVDICLSPFPYTGTTTVAHALWMGVPTLSVVGATNPSHAAACYLAHLGLSSFIAYDEATYVKLGVFLSENLPALAAMRASMRERFTNSMLGYPAITAAALEEAFCQMWHRWCAGALLAPLRVRLSDLQDTPEQETAP